MTAKASAVGVPGGRLRLGLSAAGLTGLVSAWPLGAVVIVLVARWSPLPVVFLGAGLAGTFLVAAGAAALALHGQPTCRRRTFSAILAMVTTALVAVAWLTPLGDPPPAAPENVHYWPVGTASLAYRKLPALGPRREPWPVVVVHGGPGVPDLDGDAAFWGQLTARGFDVYLYQQLGAGRSRRLTNPSGYGLGRDVADLEQVRRLIGADRLILLGHSYGGVLAAGYLAAHPQRVARLVLSSPGPLDPADHSGDQATSRLTLKQRLRLYPLALQPRALLGYLLLQVNPTAAHAYLPDAEADARNDRILTRAAPGLHCTPAERPRVSGSGFYRLQYPQSATAAQLIDLRPQLSRLPTPVLMFKGRCDYQSWAAAADYGTALRHTTLIYLRHAGHNTYQDDPEAVMASTEAFLTGRPLPVPPYRGTGPPPDYQSP